MNGICLSVCAMLISSFCGASASSEARVVNLTCESLTNPLGMDVVQPRLGWVLQDTTRGQKQTAYQVLVAVSRETLDANQGELWDSGKIESDQSIQVPYGGTPLASFQTCFWKVRVWDKDGKPTSWSTPAFWTMGVLSPDDWADAQWVGFDDTEKTVNPLNEALKTARWIWYPEENPAGAAQPGTAYFRKSFEVSSRNTRSLLLLAADNQARVFLNGENLGDWSSFKSARSFDITNQLRPGRNTLAVSVNNMGDTPNPAGLLALLRVTPFDGEVQDSVTDASWIQNNKVGKARISTTAPGHPRRNWALPGWLPGRKRASKRTACCRPECCDANSAWISRCAGRRYIFPDWACLNCI